VTITFVGAGAAQTGNNAPTLTPPLHASTQAGDIVLVHASIRGTAATMTSPGYQVVADNGNERILAKIAAAGEAAPVVTFTGGAAGDDNFAQAATWHGNEPSVGNIVAAILSNASAQNINYPALTVPADNHALVVAGWKQDDWTSVATLAGMTEIAETFSITGNDAGQVWDYQIQTTATNLTAGSFVVTGGLSAVSKGLALLIRPAAAISAVTQDDYPDRVLVSVTGLTLGDDVSIYRQVGGVRTLVRAGAATDVTDPSFLRVDAELPFGVPVTYVAVVNGVAEYSTGPTTYILDGGKVALSDAIGGLAAEVVIMAWDAKTYDRQATVYKVGGRNVVVSGEYESTMTLFTETTSSANNLRALLSDATDAIIQIRQAGGYDGVDSYIAVKQVAERRWSQDGSDQRRLWDLTVAEVDGWATALEATGFTLQDIYDFYGTTGTLATLNTDYATLLAIAQAPDWT
jgi:hypothetical protein